MFRFKKSSEKKKSPGVGFYIAMAVCLGVIGVSAWTTADSILSLNDPVQTSSESGSSMVAVDRPVSGVPTPESSSSSGAEVSSKPVSSEPTAPKPAPVSSALPTNHPVPPVSSEIPVSSQPKIDTTSFIMPINGKILKPFSVSAYSHTFEDWRAHNGVDIAAVKGANVLAIGDGIVSEVRQDDMLGTVLVIDHSGLEVHYCGLGKNPAVKKGDSVQCGQVLGVINDIPSETVEETHLHLQIKQNGEWVEPLAAIGKEEKLPSETEK